MYHIFVKDGRTLAPQNSHQSKNTNARQHSAQCTFLQQAVYHQSSPSLATVVSAFLSCSRFATPSGTAGRGVTSGRGPGAVLLDKMPSRDTQRRGITAARETLGGGGGRGCQQPVTSMLLLLTSLTWFHGAVHATDAEEDCKHDLHHPRPRTLTGTHVLTRFRPPT